MHRINMTVPVVEIDGDEMTRVLWKLIKDELLLPFIDLKSEYYDLGLQNRNITKDQVTVDAANAVKKHGVGVKCATITPNKQRMEEYPELTEMWKSPNATIRSILDGTVFRTPIIINCIKPTVRTWEKPITIARHAYGDVYMATEHKTDTEVWLTQHNKMASIRSFARSCFEYAIESKQDLWFSTKDTISKIYDGEFKAIFEQEFENYKSKFESIGIEYFYTLIDDAVARVVRSKGGFIWACKNYDGDVMSDMVSSAFGSLAMMTSVLVSPDGNFAYEAAHGTVTRHYYRYLDGQKTSTNPIATIFAWTGALRKRGELDGNNKLVEFADKLEAASLSTLQEGIMTADLAPLTEPDFGAKVVDSWEFIEAIAKKFI